MKMKFYGAATLGVKGQVVIPAEAREAFCLKEKDKLVVFGAPFNKGIVLVKADSLDSMMQEFMADIELMKRLAAEHQEVEHE